MTDPSSANPERTAPAPNGTWPAAAPTVASAHPPATPHGRYALGDEIARGGMGVVHRAADTTLGRPVAVKILAAGFGPDSAAARRFAEEARVTGQLQHPGIPPIHDLGELPDGRPFLAMKLIQGRTLADLLTDRPDPAADRGRFVAVFEQVCQAVGYAHSRGVLHRDLKPANVMVGAFGEVQVMDWGLAKILADPAADPDDPAGDPERTGAYAPAADGGTGSGTVLGTPAYMPPEQARGEPADRRADVFGLGAVLSAVLTGKPPFPGRPAGEALRRAAAGDVADCFTRLDACGAEPELVALCKRCLSPKPTDRPRDAGAVAAAVAALRAEAERRAREAEADGAAARAEAREQRKRRRVQLALAAAVGLMALGGGAVGWWADRQAAERREATARRESEDRLRAAQEEARVARNRDALAALVGACEAALRAGDAARAAAALGEADRRLPDGGAGGVADRLARCRADLAVLRALDGVDQFRWAPSPTGPFPEMGDRKAIAARWRAALRGCGLDVATTPPADAAARVNASLVRGRLLTALESWLVAAPAADVRAVLRTVDPDEYRDAVRDAVLAGDAKRVAELADRPAAVGQPAEFAAALGTAPAAPIARRREVLNVALRGRPSDLTLLLTLGIVSLDDHPVAEKWFRAAVAAHPENPLANGFLATVLKDDREGVAYARTAHHLAPDNAMIRIVLGFLLERIGDAAGGAALIRSGAAELPPDAPNFLGVQTFVALTEQQRGDTAGAVARLREAIRLQPDSADAHAMLGAILYRSKDTAGAAAAFREAVRLGPQHAARHYALGMALAGAGDLDGAVAALEEAVRLDPGFTLARKTLEDVRGRAGQDARLAPPPREVRR